MKKLLIAFALSAFICAICGKKLRGQDMAGMMPPTNNLPPSFKPKAKIVSTVGLKPAALLISRPHTNAPNVVKGVVFSRGPSPYDELANVDTAWIVTTDLTTKKTSWKYLGSTHDGKMTNLNSGGNLFGTAAFIITTNL